MTRRINWIGAAAAALYVIVIGVLLYRQGLAADENPGNGGTIAPMLVALGIGLVVIALATLGTNKLVKRLR